MNEGGQQWCVLGALPGPARVWAVGRTRNSIPCIRQGADDPVKSHVRCSPCSCWCWRLLSPLRLAQEAEGQSRGQVNPGVNPTARATTSGNSGRYENCGHSQDGQGSEEMMYRNRGSGLPWCSQHRGPGFDPWSGN